MTASGDDSRRSNSQQPGNLPASTEVRPWSSLTYRQYRLLWIAGVFSVIGEHGRRTVDLVLIYQLSGGSPLQLGFLGLAQAVPLLIAGFIGGTLVDVFDRQRLLLVTQVVRVALLAVLAGLVATDVVQVWHVYAITLLTGFAQVVESPARTAIIPAMVPRSHLMNALTLNSSTRQLGMLIGPPLAGFLIVPFDASVAYLALIGMYLLSIVVLAFITVRTVGGIRGLRAVRLADVTEGWAFVWKTRFVAAIIALDVFAIILTSWRVLMPIFAIEILGGNESTLGLLLAAPAVGRLVGTTLLLFAGNVRHQGIVVLVVTMAYAISVALFAVSAQLWLSLLLMAFVGGTDGAGAIIRTTVIQTVVPDAIRGRVTSVSQVFAQGSTALGQMATGGIAVFLGAPGALLAGAAFAAVSAVVIAARIKEVVRFRQ